MTAEELINSMIPPLKMEDKALQAINWMDKFRVTQLPVIENDLTYRGLISEDLLLEDSDLEREIGDFPLMLEETYTSGKTHFYDIIKLAIKHDLQLIAVVDEEKKFLGVVSVNETSAAIGQMFANQETGGIIVLSLKERDYSLAEISRLIESNDVKILSSFVATDEYDSALIKLTLKLNKTDLSRVIATLERFSYKIIAQFQETELLSNDKERLDLLLRYLNI